MMEPQDQDQGQEQPGQDRCRSDPSCDWSADLCRGDVPGVQHLSGHRGSLDR